ncbi:MAG TPA: hypothetical protein VMU42_20415, partial [Candidatus Sulfotelmatobacter sp.]|nr:hypothetical protein [Candidatus Sulfotelmatobacter sp.]
TPTMKIGATARFTLDRAVDSFDAYTTNELGLNHTLLLGNGRFVLTTATYGIDEYDEPDPSVSFDNRRDNTLRVRSTYGTPIGAVADALGAPTLPRGIADILWTFTVEGTWAESTITNFSYNNYKLQTLLTKRWEF